MTVSVDAYGVKLGTGAGVRIDGDTHVGITTARNVVLNVHADTWSDAVEVWRALGEVAPTPIQESWHRAAAGSDHPTWFATVRAKVGPLEVTIFPPHGSENRYTSAEDAVMAWVRANNRYSVALVTENAVDEAEGADGGEEA